MNQRHLVAVLACRNGGSRLYGKPLQRLDVNNAWCILDQVVDNLRRIDSIQGIVLAISQGSDNYIYFDYASRNNLLCISGDEVDVLGRLLQGLKISSATDLFRVTTESPFLYWQIAENAWKNHVAYSYDATFLDDIIDGCGFEIITKTSLQESWNRGNWRHRSEMCSLYIRQNFADFKIHKLEFPAALNRKDLRLTVDYPEDLVVARAVYQYLVANGRASSYDLSDIVHFLDRNQELVKLVSPFAEAGYSTMYL